jgi:hypothetical protein
MLKKRIHEISMKFSFDKILVFKNFSMKWNGSFYSLHLKLMQSLVHFTDGFFSIFPMNDQFVNYTIIIWENTLSTIYIPVHSYSRTAG